MTIGLNKHSEAEERGQSGLKNQAARNQDSQRAKQGRNLKESNQGTASNGKHNRRSALIESRVSLQGSNKSARKITTIGDTLVKTPRGVANAFGGSATARKKVQLLNNDQNVRMGGQVPLARYYPDNIQFPKNRQSLFGLSMNQVLRPVCRAKGNNNSVLLIHNKQLQAQPVESKLILKPHQVSLEERNNESNQKDVGTDSAPGCKSQQRFKSILLHASSNPIIQTSKPTP